MRGTRVRNPYKVLGIASTADDQRIKSAFRRRALTTHPDLNPGNDRAEERFRELMQAYQVLRDTRARAAYDAHIAQQRSRARRRFMQSAAVMVATFVLTTSSAVFNVWCSEVTSCCFSDRSTDRLRCHRPEGCTRAPAGLVATWASGTTRTTRFACPRSSSRRHPLRVEGAGNGCPPVYAGRLRH